MRIFEETNNKEQNIDIPTIFDIRQWIIDNIQKSKLAEVKKFLGYFENYFDVDQPKMIEHVYRGIKNSLKVEYAHEETESFVRMLIYLLSPDKKKFDPTSTIEKDFLQLVGERSFLVNFFHQTIDAKDKIETKGNYLLFDKATLTFLGSNIMFYYILTSVVEVTDRILKNSKYSFGNVLDWQEAITVYVLSEFRKDKYQI